MTQEEKAKAYDERLVKARKEYSIHEANNAIGIMDALERVFPELKESEDERIRKSMVEFFQNKKKILERSKDLFRPKAFPAEELSLCNNALTYLEKQSKQEEHQVYETEDGEIITYSETDGYKVEPKFKVGDWILYSGDHYEGVRHITKIDEKGYYVERNGLPHCIIPFNHEICMRLWTIADAEDGDVLEFGDHGRLVVGIVSYVNKTTGKVDVNCLLENNNFKVGNYYNLDTIKPHPATKEQRDLLFRKMKEAGYEWDNEKKKLKKISQRMISAEAKEALYDKPIWNKEDETMLEVAIRDTFGRGHYTASD